jgi:hypothetical protein
MKKNNSNPNHKGQGPFDVLRKAYETGQGVVVFHFETEVGVKCKKEESICGNTTIKSGIQKWTQQMPIQRASFFDFKGRFDVSCAFNTLKAIQSDLGAKYFTI